jgi:hypothetical protein
MGKADVVCRFCGEEEFVITNEDVPVQKPSIVAAPKVVIPTRQDANHNQNACCPNPDCSETIVPMHERYCSRCDSPLKYVSADLWITKVVRPALTMHAAEILKDPSKLLTSAEDIGLDVSEAEEALATFFVELSGKNHYVIHRWIHSSVLPQFRKNISDESARRRAVKDAESEGINRDFAEYAVGKISSSTKHKSDSFSETKGYTQTESQEEKKRGKQINTFEDTNSKRKKRWWSFWLITIIGLLMFSVLVLRA